MIKYTFLKSLFDGLYAKKLQTFLCKTYVKTMTQFGTGKSSHSGTVPDDSGSQDKSPVLDLKGGLGLFRKSQKISTASVELCKKKLQGGGQIYPQQEQGAG